MRLKNLLGIFLSVAVLGLASCKNDDPNEPSGEGFDKEEMLENIGENVILANYSQLKNSVDGLESKAEAFELSKNETSLNALRDQFTAAHLAWQQCSPFEFGPAADLNLRLALNTFPTDTAKINQNITNGSVDFNAAQNADAKGFPALEYLFFEQSVGDAVSKLSKPEVWAYVDANINFISDLVDQVNQKWESDYLTEFKTNTGSSVGSSLGMLVNELNYDFELIKNAKIGIPLGKKTLGEPQLDQIEAPYSKTSLALAIANLSAVEALFAGADGSGLDDYLDALGAQYNGEDLSAAIKAGFEESELALESIESDLTTAISDNPNQVENAYAALQNLVVLLKVDMPSQLGVQITYQDNDGD